MLTKLQKDKLDEISTPWPDKKPDIKPSRSKWFNLNHMKIFRELIMPFRDGGMYMELGTWTGAGSTNFVANEFPSMTMLCVDTFEGSEEHQRIAEYKPIAAKLWDHFCDNHFHNRGRLYPFQTDTITGMRRIAAAGIEPDVLYIDAAHDAQAVYDDIRVALECFPNAVILGDDYVPPGFGHPGVREGVQRAQKEGLFKADEFKHHKRIWHLTRNV
jgi:hypothetical protein